MNLRWMVASLALVTAAACRREGGGDPLPPGDYTPRPADHHLAIPVGDRDRLRADALRRAKVWLLPSTAIAAADFTRNPSDAFAVDDVVACKFELKPSEGRTPKFQCIVAGGEVIKVKYGRNNPETFGEVAATRLVSALGYNGRGLAIGTALGSVLARRVLGEAATSLPYPTTQASAVPLNLPAAAAYYWNVATYRLSALHR